METKLSIYQMIAEASRVGYWGQKPNRVRMDSYTYHKFRQEMKPVFERGEAKDIVEVVTPRAILRIEVDDTCPPEMIYVDHVED